MTEQNPSPSRRDQARAQAKNLQTKGFERREAIFDLFVSGFSHHQIAKSTDLSPSTVRRIIDTALAERRPDSADRFVRVQVARLMKALSLADQKLEQGDARGFAPYIKIVAALDRYHGLESRGLSRRPPAIPAIPAAAPQLALPAAAPPEPRTAEVADFGAQPFEMAGEATDA